MSLKVSRILHAGYIFETENARVVFDPIFENPFSVNCHAFPPISFDEAAIRSLRFDAVFISHIHDDHCSFASLDLFDRKTPIYIYCLYPEMIDLIKALGFECILSLKLDAPVKITDIEITPRRALDADVDSIFHIKSHGLNILNIVDSWIDDETLTKLTETSPWDLVLWPFQTMREIEVIAPFRESSKERPEKPLPEEWISQLKQLSPRYIVPSSCQFKLEPWSWYNEVFFPVSYQTFQNEMLKALPNAKVIRLDPGVSILFDGSEMMPAERLDWIRPVGNQNVDYEFDSLIEPPKMGEIASRFPSLDAASNNRVERYCETELAAKLAELEPSDDPYFEDSKTWDLVVYDSDDKPKRFKFELTNGILSKDDRRTGEPSWTTEISAFKLWSALERGEALSSLYIRITGGDFDITHDPLIRSLYSREIGSYQREQLRQLLS